MDSRFVSISKIILERFTNVFSRKMGSSMLHVFNCVDSLSERSLIRFAKSNLNAIMSDSLYVLVCAAEILILPTAVDRFNDFHV